MACDPKLGTEVGKADSIAAFDSVKYDMAEREEIAMGGRKIVPQMVGREGNPVIEVGEESGLRQSVRPFQFADNT